jgi:zinc transport system substrate-binding protein
LQRNDLKALGIRILLILFFLSTPFSLTFPTGAKAENEVVATTSLTAAIAKAAGAKEVKVLTPPGQKHPPEYDLKPSDLLKIEGAAVVVYAGYEKMVSKLLETAKNRGIQAIQISTDTSPETLIAQARKISKILKSEKEEEAWEQNFLRELAKMKKKLSPYAGKRAVVHHFAQPFAKWAGLTIVHVIRPGELTPRAIAEAAAQAPDVVVDILHFPVAKVIAENAKCRYAQVINFPGVNGTSSLEDIFQFNSTELIKAFHP